MKNKVIVIVGPTASGKTGYSIHIAEEIKKHPFFHKSGELSSPLSAEIISADSRQIYRGMDIGTGKVTEREMAGVPHHMLGIVDPGEIYSAHCYATEACRCMSDIWARGNLPIICGGTGLYIDALFGRVELGASGRNEALRAVLENKTCEELFAILEKEDPTRAEAIASKGEQTNKVRLVRAIEIARHARSESPKVPEKNVWLSDSDPRTFSKEAFGDERSLDTLWLGLRPTPTELRSSITKRLHERLAHGMLEEVARLHSGALSWERMEKLGLEYRYCARHLQGILSREELETILEQKIWQYAKRQINWWKRNPDIHWFHPTQVTEMDTLALAFLKG